MFADVDDRTRQAAFDHAGHGDQELVGEVGRLRRGVFVVFFRHGNPCMGNLKEPWERPRLCGPSCLAAIRPTVAKDGA
ncbi:hypothetical protein SDC9_181991 [bioreactor metagenome]|uniref:Uncharacterized protein n=1 Tax=bioreactor metagenome TaxID=1076179 RepID=A0A645H645_9ZZZZ